MQSVKKSNPGKIDATTEEMLGLITALRQRLEQAESQRDEPGLATAQAGTKAADVLRRRIAGGGKSQQLLQSTLYQAGGAADLPGHLTNGAVRLLRQGRDVLAGLKENASEPFLQDEDRPAALHYQDTVLLADLVVRALQTLPEQAGLQMRHCSGVDVLLGLIQQRAGGLEWIVKQQRYEEQKLRELAKLLRRLHQETLEDVNPFFALAEVLVQEANDGQLLGFPQDWESEPSRFVAAHCLATARVVVRVAREDSRWAGSLLQPVVAALVHDVGMLTIPDEVLTKDSSPDEEQRLILERHCRAGANLLAGPARAHPWLIEATRGHHERPDGTGYPTGAADGQIDALAGLVGACSVYAALCSPRPYRPALDTRAALEETQALAKRGQLDQNGAQLLLRLTAYPPGTAVELSDGTRGVVLAAERGGGSEERPARPVVVALLVAKSGRPFPFPQFVDLSTGAARHVRRSLTAVERTRWFGPTYPQHA